MTVTVEAIYENGTLRLVEPLEVMEGTRVEVQITTSSEATVKSLSQFIGTAQGCFASPQEADEFIRKERDAWDS